MRVALLCGLFAPLAANAIEPPITALAFAPGGKTVLAGSQAGVHVLSWPELKPTGKLQTELAHVHDLAFSPDGKTLAIAGGTPAEKGTVELIDWPTEKLRHRMSLHTDVIHAVAWSANSATLATASADKLLRIIDALKGKETLVLEGHSRAVLAAVFLPGDKQVITAGVDGTLRVWNLASGKVERDLSNHTQVVTGLALRPSQDKSEPALLASISDDRTVRLWQPTLGRMVRFARLTSAPRAVAWTPDGRWILVACKDGTLRTIDPETVEVHSTTRGIEGVAYSLAVASDGSILLGGRDGQLKRLPAVASKR